MDVYFTFEGMWHLQKWREIPYDWNMASGEMKVWQWKKDTVDVSERLSRIDSDLKLQKSWKAGDVPNGKSSLWNQWDAYSDPGVLLKTSSPFYYSLALYSISKKIIVIKWDGVLSKETNLKYKKAFQHVWYQKDDQGIH